MTERARFDVYLNLPVAGALAAWPEFAGRAGVLEQEIDNIGAGIVL